MPTVNLVYDVGGVRDNNGHTSRQTATPSTAPGSARDPTSFHAIKQRVTSLKQEQQRILRNQRTAEEMESVALLEQRFRYENTIHQLEQKLAQTQDQLKANLDRSTKYRLHCERDKKALSTQLEQVKRTLDGIESEHENKVSQLTVAHEQQLASLKQELESTKEEADQQGAARAAAHAAELEDVDQWCTGEIEAVRHVAAKQQQEAQQQLEHWQAEFETQRQLKGAAEDNSREAERQLAVAQEEVVRLTSELADCQIRNAALEQQCQQAVQHHQHTVAQLAEQHKCELEQEVNSLKARHAQQLELINTRLQDVMGKKDNTISQLRAQLAEVNDKLQQLQAL